MACPVLRLVTLCFTLLASTCAMAASPAGCVSVTEARYGAKGDNSTDDSGAFASAIQEVNALRKDGSRVSLCIPPGYYRLASRSLPTFLYGGLVIGTYHQSIITIDPSYKGDVFSWSEAWEHGSSYSADSLPLRPVSERAGPGAVGVVVTGSPHSENLQNAFVFYDRNDLILMRDVEVRGMHGRGLVIGTPKSTALAYGRESSFFNVYLSYCGAITDTKIVTGTITAGSRLVTGVSSEAGLEVGQTVFGTGIPDGDEVAEVGQNTVRLTEPASISATTMQLSIWTDVPAMEISSAGNGDSSNEMNFYDLNILESAGRGLVIRNRNPGKRTSQLRFYGLRLEGGLNGRGDQLQIGDTGQIYRGGVSDILISGLVSNTSVSGFSAVGIYAGSQHEQPYGITVQGQIPTGKGIGLNVQAGRLLRFQMQDMGTTGTDLVVGAAPLVGQQLIFDGNGIEHKWTIRAEPSSASFMKSPSYNAVQSLR